MLDPSDIEKIPKKIEKIMNDTEHKIMEDIIRRIKINSEITRSADWQIQRLIEMGTSKEFIQKTIQEALSLSDDEIGAMYLKAFESEYVRNKRLYEALGLEQIPFAENKELQQLIKSIIEQTKDEMVNLTQSMGFAVDMGAGKIIFTPLATYYQNILDNNINGIITGAFDYQSALKRTVTEMTNSGIRTVDYASGWSNRINVAARRAIVTGIGQITGKVNEMNANELGTDVFEVSWHATARPTHQVWQGKVYTMEELHSVCGLGTVDGLCGANCYHSYSPFVEGVSERTYTDEQLAEMNRKENTPQTYNDKQYTAHEATQRMRTLETRMRAQREKIKLLESGGADEETVNAIKTRYRMTSHEYTKFAETMELPQERQRVYIDNLRRVVK